jgi:hypothetical protein
MLVVAVMMHNVLRCVCRFLSKVCLRWQHVLYGGYYGHCRACMSSRSYSTQLTSHVRPHAPIQEEYFALRDQYMKASQVIPKQQTNNKPALCIIAHCHTVQGFIVVYSVTSKSSLQHTYKVIRTIHRMKESTRVPIVLVGMTTDCAACTHHIAFDL